MQLTLLTREELKEIPSASGIEIINDSIYVIGDNSIFLYVLNKKYEIKDKILIASPDNAVNDIIPKAKKHDYEAMASVEIGNDKLLLIFGSGSKSPERDSLAIVSLDKKTPPKTYSLKNFYETIRAYTTLNPEEMNIEAAVTHNNCLYLFNRGKNRVLECALNDFRNHIENEAPAPLLKAYKINLPSAGLLQAGFSGATIISKENKIVFTASIENTANWIEDGEIMGSYIGIIDLRHLKDNYTPPCILIGEKKQSLKIKVESIAVLSSAAGKANLLLVTDSDGAVSEIISAQLAD